MTARTFVECILRVRRGTVVLAVRCYAFGSRGLGVVARWIQVRYSQFRSWPGVHRRVAWISR
jgi:hypothetical protein